MVGRENQEEEYDKNRRIRRLEEEEKEMRRSIIP